MELDTLWHWLYETDLATQIRENASLFPWLEAIHVLSLCLVIGSIAVLDLRLLGIASRQRAVADVVQEVVRVTWSAFAFATLSGALLFASNAPAYAHNGPFRYKVLLLLLLGANAGLFHLRFGAKVSEWAPAEAVPWGARLSGLASIVLWIGVTALGRWIGFTLTAL
jgi:hypothetical protein